MEAKVISMADYKIKKQEVLPQYNIWWLPVVHVIFIPPFFWGFIIK